MPGYVIVNNRKTLDVARREKRDFVPLSFLIVHFFIGGKSLVMLLYDAVVIAAAAAAAGAARGVQTYRRTCAGLFHSLPSVHAA